MKKDDVIRDLRPGFEKHSSGADGDEYFPIWPKPSGKTLSDAYREAFHAGNEEAIFEYARLFKEAVNEPWVKTALHTWSESKETAKKIVRFWSNTLTFRPN